MSDATIERSHETRFQEQVDEYQFPYHYIPHERDGGWFLHRHLGWGMEYLTVLTEVRRRVLAREPDRVLDVGTGDARLPFELASHSRKVRVTGVDPVPQAVAYARAFCHRFQDRVQIVEGWVEDLDQRDFDVATAMEVFEHIPDALLPAVVQSLWERLLADGRLIVSVPTIARDTHPKHERHYTAELLAAQLRPWFHVETVDYLYRDGLRERALGKLLLNRFGLFTLGPHVRTVTRWYRRWVLPADERTGTHLIAVCRPERR